MASSDTSLAPAGAPMGAAAGPGRTRRPGWALLAALLLGIAVGALVWRARAHAPVLAPLPVRIATSPKVVATTTYLAAEDGSFARAGITASLHPYPSGTATLAALAAGEVDLATAAETPIMHALLGGSDLVIVATLATASGSLKLVGRKDRGIAALSDLVGRTIAVTHHTNTEYFLHNLLVVNGLDPAATTHVHLAPDRLAAALEAGEVDAVVSWDSFILPLAAALGDNAAIFSGEGIYSYSWNLVGRRGWVEANQQAVERVLVGLRAATATANQDKTRTIADFAARTLHFAPAVVALLGGYEFTVALDQSLLMNLENQARWARAGAAPNFLPAIDPRPLLAVHPEAVTVIHGR